MKRTVLPLKSAVTAKPNATAGATAIPGLHIVANLSVPDSSVLLHFTSFKQFIDLEIDRLGLTKVGQVYHDFPGGGFTGVVCLTESHLSIHTWPENNYLTFDVFLSNHLKDNRATTVALFERVREFFAAEILFEQIINR